MAINIGGRLYGLLAKIIQPHRDTLVTEQRFHHSNSEVLVQMARVTVTYRSVNNASGAIPAICVGKRPLNETQPARGIKTGI